MEHSDMSYLDQLMDMDFGVLFDTPSSSSSTMGCDMVSKLSHVFPNRVNRTTIVAQLEDLVMYIKQHLGDNMKDTDYSELLVLAKDSVFIHASEDIFGRPLSQIPRFSYSKRGRPTKDKALSESLSYEFELRLEKTNELKFVLYSASDIPPNVEIMVYRGVFKLIPTEDLLLQDTYQTFIQVVPRSEQEVRVDTHTFSGMTPDTEYTLVVDAGKFGNISRFAGFVENSCTANSKVVLTRNEDFSCTKLSLKSFVPISKGDRITVETVIAPYTHTIQRRKKRSPSIK